MTNNRTEEMPPLQTLYEMFEEWRMSFPLKHRPERDAPNTKQLEDAWIAGFAKHNEITCATQSLDARPAVAADARVAQMDWQQVALNGGPPCFAVLDDEDGYYCGRAERWEGHDGEHRFISLQDLLTAYANQRGEERWREAIEEAAQKAEQQWPLMSSFGSTETNHYTRACHEAAAAIRALLPEGGK